MGVVRVGAAQIKIGDNPSINTKKILEYIKLAKQKDIDIVCFPEDAIVSDMRNVVDNRKYLSEISEACKKNKLWVIVGTLEKINKKNYNIAYLFDRKGKIRYKYKKIHLWWSEGKFITPGKKNRVVNTEFGKIGIIICWDHAFGKDIRTLALDGAKIIFCPNFMVNYKGAEDLLRSYQVSRAFDNMCFFVNADAVHKRTAQISTIATPFTVLKRIERKEGLIYADIKPDSVIGLRKEYENFGQG